MRIWRAEPADGPQRPQRLAAPLEDIKSRLTGVIGEAHKHFMGARDSASGAIADNPLRWSVIALAAGVILGAALAYRRSTRTGGHWR